MKKLLMMAAIAALSSSAWADETKYGHEHVYSYSLAISELPDELTKENITSYLPSDLLLTLINPEDGQIYGQVSAATLATAAKDGTALIDPAGKFALDSISIDINSSQDGTKVGTMSMKLYTDDNFQEKAEKAKSTYEGVEFYLILGDVALELSSELRPGGPKTLSVKPSNLTSFGTDASYAMLVPEPTSGLLLLLGVAGLALKRKRA